MFVQSIINCIKADAIFTYLLTVNVLSTKNIHLYTYTNFLLIMTRYLFR